MAEGKIAVNTCSYTPTELALKIIVPTGTKAEKIFWEPDVWVGVVN